MAEANLNLTSLATSIKVQYEKRLMVRALPRMVHMNWAERPTMGKFGSYELRKYGALSTVTSTLTEGTTPSQQSAPTITTLTMTPAFYGAYIAFTDMVDLEVMDPWLLEVSGILGEQVGLSADTIVRDALTNGATKDYSGDASARASLTSVIHEISYVDIVKQITQFEADSALPQEGDDFIMIIHPHTYASLLLDPTFVSLFEREVPNAAIRTGLVGRLLRCRIYVTSNAREYADTGSDGTTDVYSGLMIGRNSHAILGISGATAPSIVDNGGEGGGPMTGQAIKPVELIVKQVGSAGAVDPLNQRGTVGWRMALSTYILESTWIRDLEHVNRFSAE